MLKKQADRKKRHKRVRAKIKGTAKKPRLCVFRSNKHIYAQLVDDEKEKTLLEANDRDLNKKSSDKKETARETGKLIAKKALEKNIKEAVFDRAGYKYHGRVKALADSARKEGLRF